MSRNELSGRRAGLGQQGGRGKRERSSWEVWRKKFNKYGVGFVNVWILFCERVRIIFWGIYLNVIVIIIIMKMYGGNFVNVNGLCYMIFVI